MIDILKTVVIPNRIANKFKLLRNSVKCCLPMKNKPKGISEFTIKEIACLDFAC